MIVAAEVLVQITLVVYGFLLNDNLVKVSAYLVLAIFDQFLPMEFWYESLSLLPF